MPVTHEIVGAAPIESVSRGVKLELTRYDVLVEVQRQTNGISTVLNVDCVS